MSTWASNAMWKARLLCVCVCVSKLCTVSAMKIEKATSTTTARIDEKKTMEVERLKSQLNTRTMQECTWRRKKNDNRMKRSGEAHTSDDDTENVVHKIPWSYTVCMNSGRCRHTNFGTQCANGCHDRMNRMMWTERERRNSWNSWKQPRTQWTMSQ